MSFLSGMLLGPIVIDKRVEFRGLNLNRSREMPPEAVGCGIFYRFFHCNF